MARFAHEVVGETGGGIGGRRSGPARGGADVDGSDINLDVAGIRVNVV
jgi:hypothetical protein